MKRIATAFLMLACGAGVLIGCEKQEEVPTTPPPTPEVAPDATDPALTAPTDGVAAPATQAAASLTIANQFCAVMPDHKADPKVTTVEGDKTIGFCCEDCIPTFKKDPAKYLASLK